MLIEAHPVSPWQSNCYLVAADTPTQDDPTPCLIVDPGIMSFDVIVEALQRLNWCPVAILLTHGHIDHGGDAHLVARKFGIAVFCAEADQAMLARPSLGLGEASVQLVEQFLGEDSLPLPPKLNSYGGAFQMAGLSITPFAAPGHTAGSTLLDVTGSGSRVLFTGDVVFAGTIGRTDLPGGSMAQMRETLARIGESFSGDISMLPGHGPGTTLARERASNPFMQDQI